MKKLVCEVCGSSSIRKENDVFVCKGCGVEYSLDQVKCLLVDADGDDDTGLGEKDKLMNILYVWYRYLLSIEEAWSLMGPYYPYGFTTISNIWGLDLDPIWSLGIRYQPSLSYSDFQYRNYSYNTFGKYLFLRYFYVDNKHQYWRDSENPSDVYWQSIERFDSNVIKNAVTKYGPFYVCAASNDRFVTINYYDDFISAVIELFKKNIKSYSVSEKDQFAERSFEDECNMLDAKRALKDEFKKMFDYADALIEQYKIQYEYVESKTNIVKENFVYLRNLVSAFDNLLLLANQYKSSYVVGILLEALRIGKADTFKEVINMYDRRELGGLSFDPNNASFFDLNIIRSLPNGDYIADNFDRINEIYDCSKGIKAEYKEIQSRPEKEGRK